MLPSINSSQSELFIDKGGDNTEKLNENLLNAWLKISTSIINSRVVSELSYNESLVCNYIYQNIPYEKENPLTATDLCNKAKMLKSQMNRTLNKLEKKGIIVRERSSQDKRQVFVLFNKDKAEAYELQHNRILKLLDGIINELGKEKTAEAIEILTNIADIADGILGNK